MRSGMEPPCHSGSGAALALQCFFSSPFLRAPVEGTYACRAGLTGTDNR